MFQFAPFAFQLLCIQRRNTQGLPGWVSPFGNFRVNGYLRLTETYRSLSRPSSPADAKASPVCPCSLPTSPSSIKVYIEKKTCVFSSLFPYIQHWKPIHSALAVCLLIAKRFNLCLSTSTLRVLIMMLVSHKELFDLPDKERLPRKGGRIFVP